MPEHSSETASAVDVRSSPVPPNVPNGKGDSYRAGDVVVRSEPWVYSLHPRFLHDHCYRCCKYVKPKAEGGPAIPCAECGLCFYCSNECRVEELEKVNKNSRYRNFQRWDSDKVTRHGDECKLLRNVTANGVLPAHDVLIMLKALLRIKKGEITDTPLACDPPSERDFKRLLSHKEEIRQDPPRIQYIQELHHLLALHFSEKDVNTEELLKIYGKIKVNSFDIRDQHLQRIGEGVYFGPSGIDHSCQRNATFFFEGPDIVIRTITDIKNADDVRISYTEIFTTNTLRKNELRQWYYFDCGCPLCADPVREADLQSILCPEPGCQDAIPLDSRAEKHHLTCSAKGKSNPSQTVKEKGDDEDSYEEAAGNRVRRTQRLLAIDNEQHIKIEQMLRLPNQQTGLHEVEQRCERMLESAKDLLHPSNYMLGVTLDKYGKAMLAGGKYEAAADLLERSIPAIRKVLYGNDPRLGLQILTVALLKCKGKKPITRDIVEEAAEAQHIFSICDGAGRSLCKEAGELHDLLAQALKNNVSLTEHYDETLPERSIQDKIVRLVNEVLPILKAVLCTSLFPLSYAESYADK